MPALRRRCRFLLLLLCCLDGFEGGSREDVYQACQRLPNQTIKIGIITKGNVELTMERWTPTFETYLSSSLAQYGCSSVLVPVGFATYDNQTRDKDFDFFFGNPTAFTEMHVKYGLSEFVSLLKALGDTNNASAPATVVDRFGGVIVRAAQRLTHVVEVADLASLQGLTICAVNPVAFGGWMIQLEELLLAGVDVYGDHTVEFLGNHDDPMRHVVLTGECDIGIARTETIERLVGNGEFDLDDVYVIGERSAEDSFPRKLTTPLYPEWPLARLQHVDPALEQVIAVALLSLSDDSEAAIIGKHAGFAFPYSYEPVRQLLLSLDYYGDGRCDSGHYREDSSRVPARCLACPAGTFSRAGIGECQPCPLGTVNNGTANTDCVFCPEGTWTLHSGSVTGACVDVTEKDDFTLLILTFSVPMGMMLFVFFLSYVCLRRALRRQSLDEDDIKSLLCTVIQSSAKAVYGIVDLVTDFIVAYSILSDSSLSQYHIPYGICLSMALAVCPIDLLVSFYISSARIAWLKGNRKRAEARARYSLSKSTKFSTSKHLLESSSSQGAQEMGAEGKANSKASVPLSKRSSHGAALAAELEEEEIWLLERTRMDKIEIASVFAMFFAEDLPFILLNTIFVALNTDDECTKLPGGVLPFLLSYAASCCFVGYRIFSLTTLMQAHRERASKLKQRLPSIGDRASRGSKRSENGSPPLRRSDATNDPSATKKSPSDVQAFANEDKVVAFAVEPDASSGAAILDIQPKSDEVPAAWGCGGDAEAHSARPRGRVQVSPSA